jgi:hypothetical protein
MSDRMTWGICPTCGNRAAILWETVTPGDGEPGTDRPVELDCSGDGCAARGLHQLLALQE